MKVTAGAGAGRDETCCFGVTTLFGLVRHSSSFSSAAAFQAPCRRTGSNLSPFCTLQTMAAKLCRGVLEAGLSSAWLLAATFSTTTARLFCKVTRPSTGMDILCSMVGDGMMTMLRAETCKRWTEGDRRDALQRSGQRRRPLTKFEHVPQAGESSFQD